MINMLPDIQRTKRKIKFSNPLSGKTYNNHSFLKNCHYQVPQISSQSIPKFTDSNKKHKSVFFETKSPEKLLTKKTNRKYCYATHYFSKHKKNETQKQQKSQKKMSVEMNPIEKVKSPYNDLQVKILDAIQSAKDFKEKRLKVNFGIYFNLFFKQNLGGTTTHQFLHLAQKYLRKIIEKDELNHRVQVKDYPPECFMLKSKFSFVDKIKDLQERGLNKIAEAIVKYYCVPTEQFRQSCFRDIVHMLGRELYEKFNIPSSNKQYILLNANGDAIRDVCEIYFSTTLLFIAQKYNHQRKFSNYLDILQSSNMNFKKLSFSEGLKKSFRNRIVSGQFQDYPEDSRKVNQTATGFGKRDKTQKMLQQKSSNKSLKAFQPFRTSSQGFNSPRRISPKKSETSLSKKEKSQKKISFNHLKLDEKYSDQFYRLVGRNSMYDMTFNHVHQNQLLYKVLLKDCSLFSNKSHEQALRILSSAEVQNNETQSISLQDFKKVRIIAQCKGEKEHIIRFVRNYMPFNEFGQMSRVALRNILGFILNNQNNNRDVVEEVVWSWLQKNKFIQNEVLMRSILQSWYQKNRLAYVMMISLIFGTNEVSTLQMAYEVIV